MPRHLARRLRAALLSALLFTVLAAPAAPLALASSAITVTTTADEFGADGRYLAITCGDPLKSEALVSLLLDTSDGTIRRLKYYVLSWSPDGRQLLVRYDRPESDASTLAFELGVTNIAEDTLTPLIAIGDGLNTHCLVS